MAINSSDYIDLAAELRALADPAARVVRLIDFIRAGMDVARSEGSWDRIHGMSGQLGSHAQALAEALAKRRA